MSSAVLTPEPVAATTPIPTAAPQAAPEDRTYRLSVDQYSKMARMGILTEQDRVELLEGVLASKMTKNPPHILAARKTLRALLGVLPPGWFVAKDDPIETLTSVPEPDFTVVRGTPEDYASRVTSPRDLALVIEVSDSGLHVDQTLMKVLYAAAAIPIYWIVNIPDGRLEVYSDPTGPSERPDFHARRDYGPDDEVPLVIDGQEIARIVVRSLLP